MADRMSLISTKTAIMREHGFDDTESCFWRKMVIRVDVRQQFQNISLNKSDGGISEKRTCISVLQ